MRILFLAYRDWSLKVYPYILKNPRVEYAKLCMTTEELKKEKIENYDLLITCGWSEELGAEIAGNILAVGVHCAELDRYSYGSPIQLQVIDGIKFSKHRIFRFTYKKDSERAHTHTREYSYEVDLDLSGDMDDILYQMTATSIVLFNMFINDYPNITWKKWPEEKIVRPKRQPVDSKLTKEQIMAMNTEQIYDFIRCLEDPYPNAFLEDEYGKLFFKKVVFRKK